MNVLLARDDVNPQKPDLDRGTPVGCPTYNVHEGVMKLILSQDGVNPNKLDQYGRTLLPWASINGHKGVAGQLLARHDINPVNRIVMRSSEEKDG